MNRYKNLSKKNSRKNRKLKNISRKKRKNNNKIIDCCLVNDKNQKSIKKCRRKKDNKIFDFPRRFKRSQCRNPRGFTMKASCAPYSQC